MTTQADSPIVLTGSLSVDRIMNFSGKYRDLIQADKLHVLSLSVLIDSLVDSDGGTAGNLAYNLALLGTCPILLASLGKQSSPYLNKLQGLQIDTSHLHLSSLPTATFTVLTDSEDSQVGGFYPGAMSDSDSLTLEPWYDQDPLVVISANDPRTMNRLVGECQTHSLRYAYDPGQQVSNVPASDLARGLEGCELLFVNDYELGVVTTRTGSSEQELTAKLPLVITTLGAKGSRLSGTKLQHELVIPPVPDLTVLDPTGAGDSYRSGFLYGYLRSWKLATCARLGSVVASYVVETKGTQNHSFTLEDIRDRYQKTYQDQLPIN